MAVLSKKTALVWVLLITGVIAVWKFVWSPMQSEKMAPSASNTTEPKQGMATETMMTGEKSATVRTNYQNPGGSDDVAFMVVVDANGVITNASTEVLAVNPISKKRQEAFAADFPQALKGKKLSELTSIDKVGGSSLTTASFNAVLPELKGKL